MKRTAGAMMLLAALGGCVSTEHGPSMVSNKTQDAGSGHYTVPGVQGPWGQPVSYNPARAAAPTDGVVTANYTAIDNLHGDAKNGVVQTHFTPNPMQGYAGQNGMGACVANAYPGGPGGMMPMNKRTEVRFVGPTGMQISWYVPSSDGHGAFTPSFLTAPARYNFLQGALYRLKLSNIANRPGLELYPTLEVVPSGPRSDAFLAHSAVPLSITDEDLDQVAAGNFVVKVIYLPDPQYQDLATVGPDEVVSSRLEPGVDPLAEAHRRGNILLVVRLGNIDLEAANTPAMDAPPGGVRTGMMPARAQMMPQMMPMAPAKLSAEVKMTAPTTDSGPNKPGFASVKPDGKAEMTPSLWTTGDAAKK
jgi:hypothetical protein